MNLEAIQSFVDVVETGSFSLAAERLKVMQSTVSGRIRALEQDLRCDLFTRGRGGAELTAAGHDFWLYAKKILLAWDQGRQQVALPPGRTELIRLGCPFALQDRIGVPWALWMRRHAGAVALQIRTVDSDLLTNSISSGMLDTAIMYVPRHRSGLIIEELLREEIILVEHADIDGSWEDNLIFVDWGPEFRLEYDHEFPGCNSPAISVEHGAIGLQYLLATKGAAYLPRYLVSDALRDGQLREAPGAPMIERPIYLVHAARPRAGEALETALAGLRTVTKSLAQA